MVATVLAPLASSAGQERFWTVLHLRPLFLAVDLATILDLVFFMFNSRSTGGVGGTASRVEGSFSASDSPIFCCTTSRIRSLSLGGGSGFAILKGGL